MINDILELYIPKGADNKPITTLSSAKVTLLDMGEKTIDVDVKIPANITPDFSRDWQLAYRMEKYVMADREPQGTKSNDNNTLVYNLTFQHWAVRELKRWIFFTVQPVESGTAVADQYEASVSMNLKQMCDLFSQVLDYYFDGSITISLNPLWVYDIEPKVVQISKSTLWDVLTQFYTLWAVRWEIKASNEGIRKYVIKVGYDAPAIDHVLKYGFEGGLLSIERQLESGDIHNLLLGRGGENNLPARYFKDVDPDNPSFPADPDWIPELRNIYFDRLRGQSFRDYIKGWKTNPNRQLTETVGTPITPYPHDNTVRPISVETFDEAYAKENFAYFLGHTDSKFRPIEYVADQYEVVDLKTIQPVAGSSIARHGEFLGSIEDNEDIYPTIQGVEVDPIGRADEAIWVEQIEKDDYKEAAEYEAQTGQLEYKPYPGVSFEPGTRVIGENLGDRLGVYFTVEAGKRANITYKAAVTAYTPDTHTDRSTYVQLLETQISVYDAANPAEPIPPSGIPEGSYFFIAKFKVENTYTKVLNVVCAINDIKIEQSNAPDTWTHTFDILIKNIWGTEQKTGESDTAYAERVWGKILGDRIGNEAKVVFSDGMLATSQDYEFVITAMPKVDRTLCQWEANGETHSYRAEWRLTLAKSDADLETLGLYVPSTKRQGKAGDHFFFTGIDMPHQYVLWAEARLDAYKTDQFKTTAEANTTYAVTTDRVRINNQGLPGALINQLVPGATATLFDEQLVEGGTQTLYVSGVTITYREPSDQDAALNPDVELTLSKEYEKSANPVAVIQGEVSAISKQIGSLSNVQQVVRAIGDKLYLRKDAVPDSSLSPTQFYSLVTSGNFRSGMVGGAGWGLFQDASGAWVLEADKVNVRKEMQVNNLVINQISARGGMIVESAAAMEITEWELTGSSDHKCYFDTKNGTVANLFDINDIVLCHRFTPENGELKYYRRYIYEVGTDYIILSGDLSDGDGYPEVGDVLVQFGNTEDANRQFVIVRDVIGGGYERFIEGLNDIYATGKEYVFIGKQDGQSARFFVGNKTLGQYIEYKDGKFVISGDVRVAGKPVTEAIKDEVANLDMGVTNLFRGSAYWDKAYWKMTLQRLTPDTYTSPQYFNGVLIGTLHNSLTPYQQVENVRLGETYTISAWIKTTISQNLYFYFFNVKGYIDTTQSGVLLKGQLVVGQWVRVKHTFTVKSSVDGTLRVGFGFSGVEEGNTFIAGMKLERGSMATDYSRNPEDNDTTKFDYLREAMKENTDISGGLVQTSSILLGQTNSDGTRTVWAGTNGLYGDSRSPALWAGGNMVDAQNNTDNDPRPAKFMVRMDGTGYAAGNTVQFTDSQLKVGGDTVMDANGFYTLGTDSEGAKAEIVRIANIDLPTVEKLLNPTAYAIDKNVPGEALTITHSQFGFSLKFDSTSSNEKYYGLLTQTVPAGASLSMSATIIIDLSSISANIPTDPFAVYAAPTLVFQIIDKNQSVVYEYTQHIRPAAGGTSVAINIDNIATNLPTSGRYAARLTFVGGGIDTGSASTAAASMLLQMQGKIALSTSGQTILAKNGLASVWGENLLLVNDEFVQLRSGVRGFRIGPSGFEYTVNGSTWKALNWT